MQPDAPKLLWDIQDSLQRIARYIEGRTYDDFLQDDMLQAAVERRLAIIGEAANRLSRVDPELVREIPDVSQIVACRNILVHAYTDVRYDIV